VNASRAKVLRWERRPEERPHELLEAALHVFATRGYRNTRLEEVAAAAGVSKGAVYHYFANKEELLLRALEAHRERGFGRVAQALRGEHGPSSARLRLFFRKAFGGDDPAQRDVFLLLQSLAYEVPDVYNHWIAGGPVKAWQLLASLIEDGKASGEFRPDVDSEVAARVVLSGVLLQVIWQGRLDRVPGMAIDPGRLVDSAVELLLAGLRPVMAVPAASRHSRK
jgi:AcrR family transcriptional regulator